MNKSIALTLAMTLASMVPASHATAAGAAGAVVVPIYATNSAEEHLRVLDRLQPDVWAKGGD